MSSTAQDEKSARDSMETSRQEVMECEKEIQSIKSALRSLPLASASGGEASKGNSLKVSVHKVSSSVEGNAPSTFKVNLSSPIEEGTITKLYDPVDPTAEGSFATFDQVEISNALLTIEAFSASSDEAGTDGGVDEKLKLGVSAAHDLMPLVEGLDPLKDSGEEKKTLVIEFAIVSEDGEEGTDAKVEVVDAAAEPADTSDESGQKGDDAAEEVTEEKEEGDEEKGDDAVAESTEEAAPKNEEKEGQNEPTTDEKETTESELAKAEEEEKADEKPEASETKADDPASTPAPASSSTTSKVQIPVCTLTVHLEYTPSPIDKRDALYDKLNEVSKRKAAAIESLRQSAAAVNRAKASEASSATAESKEEKSPAVKAGFLNKTKAGGAEGKKDSPFWKRWYEKTIGPSSLLWVVGPVAKNYVVFIGCAVFFHYKGDLLALPPPV